jgi:type VI secretion system secreted protein Hcp
LDVVNTAAGAIRGVKIKNKRVSGTEPGITGVKTMAAVDFFLKIDGIPGEATDTKHSNEVDLISWSWGESNAGSHGSGGGGGAGKVAMQDFSFTMRVNKASPKLFLACASGQHIASALLTCRKAGKQQQEYLKISFTDLLVSSYQTGGSEGDVVPVDQIAFNFAKIELTYSPQKPDGSLGSPVIAYYNVETNTGG